MANFQFDFDELEKQILGLDNFDEIAPKIIEASIPELKKNVISECQKHKDTGAMVGSIKETKSKKGKSGWFSIVRPTGTDAKGVRNMEKLAHAEYGTSKQAPTPILSVAVSKSEKPIAEIMQEVYNREVEK